ncbi:MAG: TPM domain-containing protein [Planctomycetota bacterium]
MKSDLFPRALSGAILLFLGVFASLSSAIAAAAPSASPEKTFPLPKAAAAPKALNDLADWGKRLAGAPLPKAPITNKYAPYPEPDAGYVTDRAGVLTAEEEERIERRLWQAEAKTGLEIAVVTIGSMWEYPGAPQGSIESFARGLFDKYGVGNRPANKGILLLVAVRDRAARIELGAGYKLAFDREAARIMDKVLVPRFKEGKYAEGITLGVEALLLEFGGLRVGMNWPLLAMIAAIPVVGLIAYSLFKSGKRGWGWVCVGFLVMLILAVLYSLVQIAKASPRGRSGGWRAGGFGGGFGGGFSGGGGASGHW